MRHHHHLKWAADAEADEDADEDDARVMLATYALVSSSAVFLIKCQQQHPHHCCMKSGEKENPASKKTSYAKNGSQY